MTGSLLKFSFAVLVSLLAADIAGAHHVLGRPGYSLNEDSNTPPAVQGETRIGGFDAAYMVFPAFPRPHEPGRVSFYVKSQASGAPFEGKVTFTIRDNSWLSRLRFGANAVTLGTQPPDDRVCRQNFVFPDEGEYIIAAAFEADGESYTVEFPLRIGAPMPAEYIFGAILLILAAFVAIQRRRAMTGRLRDLHGKS